MSETNWALKIEQLCKTFSSHRRHFTAYRALLNHAGRKLEDPELFFALKDIHFELTRGEKLGVIGDNGSGKTTLLRLIAGLYQPNSGRLNVHGEVTLLAGLGIGMIDELSIEENVFLYGMIYGLQRKQIKEKLPEIIDWAGLQDFAGFKVKHLSSGMKERLAFSTVRHVDKDIYLFDEALAAGDKNFKEKCEVVFQGYKKTDKTFLVATHDLSFVQSFCTKALWLHKGSQISFGDPEIVVLAYRESKL